MRKRDNYSRQRKETLTLRKKTIAWFTLSLQLLIPLQGSWSAVAHASLDSGKGKPSTMFKKYQLTPGEDIASVAKKFAVTPQALAEANKLHYNAAQLNALKAGDTLFIPDARSELRMEASQEHPRWLDHMQTLATIAAQPDSEKAAVNMAKSAAVGAANRSVEAWLSRYGTARVALNLNENSDLNNSAADMLYPFYDSPSVMLFTQGGARHADDRTTLNVGLGARVFDENWMYGFNTFLDNDITGKNRRMGVGAEFGIDFLKLSANRYFRLTDWHQSRDFDDYDERPANGFDLRAEGWLPAYPQLGARLMYERYHGEQVALFGKDKRQKDPWALSAGIHYTPVPLLTFSTAHRQGRDGANDHQVNLQLNYRLGESWASHLDSERVKQSRSLTGSRYDLVERNNNIVLDYRKQELVKIALPSHLKGFAVEPLTLTASTTAKYGVKQVIWDASALIAAGGQVISNDKETLVVKLPSYRYGKTALLNQYVIGAVAYDVKGNASKRAETRIEVLPARAEVGEIKLIKDNAVANSRDSNEIEVRILNLAGEPLAGVPVAFSTESGAVITASQEKSDSAGKVNAKIAHTKAAEAVINVAAQGKEKAVKVHFIADKSTTRFDAQSVKVVKNGAFADGGSPDKIVGRLVDAHGNPVPEMAVEIALAENVQLKDGATTVTTDAQGNFAIELTSTKAEKSTVNLAVNGQQAVLEIWFAPDSGSAIPTLEAVTDGSVADGKAQNRMRISVKDANDNPVPDIEIKVSAESHIHLAATTLKTNAQGEADLLLTSTQARAGNVTIETNGKTRTLETRFIADVATAKIVDMTLVKDGAVANGTDNNELKLKVIDAHNNPVPAVSVALSSGNGAVITLPSAETDHNGELQVLLTHTRAGVSPIKASLNGAEKELESRFISDIATAQLEQDSFTVLRDRAEAGKDANEVSVKVVDAHGNPVEGAAVAFSATGGAQVASSTAQSDVNGVAKMQISQSGYGKSNVTATLNNSQTKEVTFTRVTALNARVLDSSSIGHTFTDITAGFPSTGAAGVSFDIVVNNSAAEAANYDWHSSNAAVSVSNSGRVTLNAYPGKAPVTITMADKLSSTRLTYTFTLSAWFSFYRDDVVFSVAQGKCAAENAALPSPDQLTSAQNMRAPGSFFGEWGSFDSRVSDFVWTSDGYHVHQADGWYHPANSDSAYNVVCVK